jgi:hypothetical protein
VGAIPVTIAGIEVGMAVSLGRQFVFFTTHPELSSFDGIQFSSLADLRTEIRKAMASLGEHHLESEPVASRSKPAA